MSYYGYKPYVPVAKRQAQAASAVKKANKLGVTYAPIAPFSGAVAKTFWGKAWCSNLEQYSDYASRLPRGRTYVRNGSVIDLQVNAGAVQAKVMGSSLYEVSVSITALPAARWKTVCADCSNSVASLIELLQGKLSKAVMERVCAPGEGLFPSPKEIKFECTCPDWAGLCKHVAAVLYGVGARLDAQPDLLFALRHVDAKDLVAQASTAKPTTGRGAAATKVIADDDLADVFGLDMDDGPVVTNVPNVSIAQKPAVKATAKKAPASNVVKKLPAKAVKTAPIKVPVKAAAKAPTKG